MIKIVKQKIPFNEIDNFRFFKNLRILQEYKKINSKLFSSNKESKNIVLENLMLFILITCFFLIFKCIIKKI